jgi:hypothetical protein
MNTEHYRRFIMKKWLKIGAFTSVLAMLAVLSLGTTSAFARGPVQQDTLPAHGQGYGMGFMAGERWDGPQNSLIAVMARVLGINQADLVAQLKDKTIADVAKARGVVINKIVDAFLAPRSEALKSAVDGKRLTQAQADQLLATMKTNVTAQLSNKWTPRGPGMGSGFVDANNDGVCDNRN